MFTQVAKYQIERYPTPRTTLRKEVTVSSSWKPSIEKMDSKALETVSELIGLPQGLQSTLALTLEENWNLGTVYI